MSGIGLNPILKEWFLEPTPLIGDEPLMNYIVTARKIGTTDTVTEAIS